jgi:PPOX class probable F420-dependent enzyme
VFTIDESNEFGARAARHLREDPVVWMVTVGRTGAPSANPVWFYWDRGDTIRVHSLPDAARVRHLRANKQVALHFEGDRQGGDIVVLSATGVLRPDLPAADADQDYLAKYAQRITRIGHTPRTFAQAYSMPIMLTLKRLRGF